MTEYFTYFSPIGPLCIETEDEKISQLRFCEHELISDNFNHELQKHISAQLDDYFSGYLFDFDLPIQPQGSEFQQKVWASLLQIPYGETVSYGDLAKQLGDQNLVRAIGGANSKNPIAILIPCHRVIGVNKKLVGYAGGLWRKKWLLQHEQTNNPSKSTLW